MRWPFDKRLDATHAWGIFGGGLTVLVALPGLLALEHTKGPFSGVVADGLDGGSARCVRRRNCVAVPASAQVSGFSRSRSRGCDRGTARSDSISAQ